MNRTEEIDAKPLKCNLDDIVYCKRDGDYMAFDFPSGLCICKEKKVCDLINAVDLLTKDIKKCRENPEYKKDIINFHGGLF